MFFDRFFHKRPFEAPATRLYGVLVAQARQPVFFSDLGVPDTPEGRYEMVAVHVFLILQRLKIAISEGDSGAEGLSQEIFDLMFADMDRNLREMGTGDLGVAKRVKALAAGFYGRITAYEEGLDGEAGRLASALERNVYGGTAPEGAAAVLAGYLERSVHSLKEISFPEILRGDIAFAPAPQPSNSRADIPF
jgi:cytochrome b pre-mRNA-processing protein 3